MIEILRITSAFGIKGAIRVILYTENLNQYNRLYDQNEKKYVFQILHAKGNTAILSLDNVTDRNMAEQLVGTSLFIKKTDVPILGKNKFYIFDLIGKKIKVLNDDADLQIVDVKNFGAGDLIELREEGSSSFFVPFTEENFPEIKEKMFLSAKAYKDFKN